METIGAEGKVRMDEPEGVGEELLHFVPRIENKLQPAIQ
jgi:hypothetical protein